MLEFVCQLVGRTSSTALSLSGKQSAKPTIVPHSDPITGIAKNAAKHGDRQRAKNTFLA
jgi:hypothetical protein